MSLFRDQRILIAPLNWGLGHATRCIPVIRELLIGGAEPVIAADGGALELLKQEFPLLEHHTLAGYPVQYSKGRGQVGAMMKQWPGILHSIRKEHEQLERLIVKDHIHAMISDQRFGAWSGLVPSVIMTHQLQPFTPVAQGYLRKWNRERLSKFDRIWVVDHQSERGLAGELSTTPQRLQHAMYIGPQSRWQRCEEVVTNYAVVAVISGPEPQRSIFERAVLKQLGNIPGKHLLVRGLPGTVEDLPIPQHIRSAPHLPGTELHKAMCGADLIVARSGYSTIMDLHAIGRSALLVPTPGQPEQEYLAERHARRGCCVVQSQRGLDIEHALKAIVLCKTPTTPPSEALLEQALQDLADLLLTQ